MLGAFGLLGFNSQLYALTDFSWTYDQVNFGGMAEFLKFGWEFTQGVHLLATQQLGKPSLKKGEIFSEAYSLGIQYFPRAHWEFLLSGGKERSTAASPDFDSIFHFMVHYYL